MTSIAFLADDRAEVIRGGWRSTTILTMFKATNVATNVAQVNESSNLGLGLLAGYGNAQSLQANSATIFSLAG